MGLTTISGEIQAQPLNDNFSYLNERKNDLAINIKDYGAIGDGITDDTIAIQSAVDNGGIIFFPKPSVSYAIQNILIPSNTTLIFDPLATFNIINQQNAFKIIDVTNVNIHGNGATITSTKTAIDEFRHIISISGVTNCTIQDLYLKDCDGDGIYLGGSSAENVSTNVLFNNIHTDNTGRNGLSITYAQYVKVLNSSFNNSNGFNPQSGIDLEPNVGTYVKDIVISNCVFKGNINNGIIISTDTEKAIVSHCFSTLNTTGFAISGTSILKPINCSIIDCNSYLNTGNGYYVNYTLECFVKNSYSKENDFNGMQIVNSERINFSCNKIKENGLRGIVISDAIACTISNNDIILNGSEGIASTGSNNSLIITNNRLENNGQVGAVKQNITISGGVQSLISNNYCRKGSVGTVSTHGIVVSSTSLNSFIVDNDCYLSGSTLGIYIDAGSSSVNGGNRNNDGTYSTTPN